MRATITFSAAVLSFILATTFCSAEDVLFEDTFDSGLANPWQMVGLTKEDYRVRDGALELRIHPGKLSRETPMLKVSAPIKSKGTVTVSVSVTILDDVG